MEVVQVAQYENYLSGEVIEENNLLNRNERAKKKKVKTVYKLYKK